MNFTEVVNEVLNIVKRPDKLLDIRREVNGAINQFCLDQDFMFDVEEVSPVIVSTEYTQAIPIYPTFENFRKFYYIKRGGTSCFLSRLGRADVVSGSCDMRDKYYIVGNNLNISLAALSTTLDLAYFRAPRTLSDADPEFWMLRLSPYMVIDRAASKLFTSIGDDSSANKHEQFARSAFMTAQKDYGVSTT